MVGQARGDQLRQRKTRRPAVPCEPARGCRSLSRSCCPPHTMTLPASGLLPSTGFRANRWATSSQISSREATPSHDTRNAHRAPSPKLIFCGWRQDSRCSWRSRSSAVLG